ncbi:hypothetical protein L1987_46208 [Smallanthus sonchifolius]|uniref:Uncharacterized protein n=1 Tax=Smallanthus sonchifolius TaxID=185202 RepID=A0ACB9G054_9ASTR|nr:hypothetical protein L1987_46208 [Smallanthus sonchifolius]
MKISENVLNMVTTFYDTKPCGKHNLYIDAKNHRFLALYHQKILSFKGKTSVFNLVATAKRVEQNYAVIQSITERVEQNCAVIQSTSEKLINRFNSLSSNNTSSSLPRNQGVSTLGTTSQEITSASLEVTLEAPLRSSTEKTHQIGKIEFPGDPQENQETFNVMLTSSQEPEASITNSDINKLNIQLPVSQISLPILPNPSCNFKSQDSMSDNEGGSGSQDSSKLTIVKNAPSWYYEYTTVIAQELVKSSLIAFFLLFVLSPTAFVATNGGLLRVGHKKKKAGQFNQLSEHGLSMEGIARRNFGFRCKKHKETHIKKHACSNAKTEDLWVVLEEESKEPVHKLMHSWTKQKGYPIVSVSVKDSKLVFEQK